MKCPNCGHEIANNELFCEICGMRVNIKSVGSKVEIKQIRRQIQAKDTSTTYRTFKEWCLYWAELYVENYEFWSYLVYEHIDDEEFTLPLFVCAHQFNSHQDMQSAYIDLCSYGRDLGFGMPSDYVFMSEEDNRWYVLLTCSDLPLVLMIADYYHGQLWGWADYFISMPPMPIDIEKSHSTTTKKTSYAPIKVKKQIKNLKVLAKKQLHSQSFKLLSRDVNVTDRKGTYRTTWQCHKCMTVITTVQENAGFLYGYGDGQLRQGPCAMGGDHDWHQLTQGEWID